ncbi:thioredoxin reductase (NADPH) [Singulisphaera sp. GP187]|uniref:FAD-dependent oxidoreductase n=1 Tax=Singulisphaera sp. GP187 TaxID=1882752 RepID=UPI00092911C8|nr:cyclic nucleotide-binding domain-containing thioredoxin-disulfide reductase [Singulisphaera sp. GP187]SIO62382.1 thioredoxin reductase (NADPH) [Singulisphaera sp. GP187]
MASHDLHAAAFPALSESQISSLAECTEAKLTRFQDGQALFKVGARNSQFFVVKSGQIEVRDESGDMPRILTVHSRGEFSGDESLLSGAGSLVSGYARGETEVFGISTSSLRQVLNRCPDLGDLILQAFIARRQLLRESGEFTGLRVLGSRYSQDTFRIRDFLARNRVLFTWLDLEADQQVVAMLKQFGVTEAETPVVICGQFMLHRNPSNLELAETIGLRRTPDQTVYDLAVVGAGPAGLAAAVYGASEGLSTVILERTAAGGQASRSMRIENYLGFPTGVTGAELTERAVVQANKFGAMLSVPTPVIGLTFENSYAVLSLEGGGTVIAKSLLIATGADYRKLGVEGCDKYEGCGVYYAATPNEVQMCHGAEVLVVGGGNSAGQAAVFLASQARKVNLLIRGDDLAKSMSMYLVRRIEQTATIEVLRNTEIKRMRGNGYLDAVDVVNNQTGEERTIETPAVFSFIGAVPRCDWVSSSVERDPKGFIRTGPNLESSTARAGKRAPFFLETSRPGVFAAGDVRSSSVKRVASAVGEGAMAVQFVHAYLSEK